MGGDSQGETPLFVSFGAGLQFMPEDYYLHQFKQMGVTKRQFRKFCRDNGVPLVQTSKGWWVERSCFQLVLAEATMPGRPDFIFPGAPERRKNRLTSRRRYAIDPIFLNEHVDVVTARITAARVLAGLPADSKEAARTYDRAAHLLRLTRERLAAGASPHGHP